MAGQVSIDDVLYAYEGDFTVYQFCFSKGIYLPCFCYHEKLSIAGNCRMCLVEVNGSLVVSCAMPLLSDMVVFTQSQRVQLARESVLEFLLINHPLDCPICDQGGECDLQDISLVFGPDRGRFYEVKKRAVSNLNFAGPLVKAVMTRCIHCTRCVRFLNEVSGVFDLGIVGRGSSMEIGTYIARYINHELMGNIIDLCPVGAFTAMPFAFTARPWELTPIESIDVLDAIASSIRVDVANNQVMRILPRLSESVNEEWLSNKARFCYDSFTVQRLNYPRIRVNNYFIVISWSMAINIFFEYLAMDTVSSVDAIIGPFLDMEGCFSLKQFFHGIGCSNINYQFNFSSFFDYRFGFLLSSTLAELERVTFCFFLGLNLRTEAPLLNSRLRKSFLASEGHFLAFSAGLSVDYKTFPVFSLGNSLRDFKAFVEGRNAVFARLFFEGSSIFLKFLHVHHYFHDSCSFFFGSSILNRPDCGFFLAGAASVINRGFGNIKFTFNVISNFLGRISAFELGTLPGVHSSRALLSPRTTYSFSYLLGTDSLSSSEAFATRTTLHFLVYQGSFSYDNCFFQSINLFLPVSIYTERVSTYLNVEGRLRRTQKAVTPFRFVYSDYEVLQALFLFRNSFYKANFSIFEDFFFVASFFSTLIDYSCIFFVNITEATFRHYTNTSRVSVPFDLCFLFLNYSSLKVYNSVISRASNHYYSSDHFSRNSKILSLCFTKVMANSSNFAELSLL